MPDSSLSELLLPIASASAAARRLHRSASTGAPRLHPLQLLLATCVCFSCYSPIASVTLPDCVRFGCCSSIASASVVAPRLRPLQLLLRLHLQLPDCVRFHCCSPILHPSAVLEASSQPMPNVFEHSSRSLRFEGRTSLV